MGLGEKLYNLHKNPMNLFAHLVGLVIIAYSLWINSLEGILIGLLIAVIGHIYEEVKKKGNTKMIKTRKRGKTKRKRKIGALEMSIGTIVIMVIAVTMLILGIVFVRSVMCAGIQMSEDISKGTRDEITKLFGASKDGVKCAGEGTSEPLSMGSGGRRNLICIIKSEENIEYQITIKNIENLKRPSDNSFENWILDKDWEGSVAPGGDGTDAVVAVLDIPKEVSATSLKFTIESTNLQTSVKKTHYAYVDIVPANFFTGTMC